MTTVAATPRRSLRPDLWNAYRRLRSLPLAGALNRITWPAAVIDHQFNFIYVNPALCRLVGRDARELVGLGISALATEVEEKERRALRREVAQHAIHKALEIRTASGRVVPVSLRMFPLSCQLLGGVDIGVAYLAAACAPGDEAARDDALIAIAWGALADGPAAGATRREVSDEPSPLSRREEQVNTLVSFGCDTKRIASVLGIGDSTVRVLRARVRHKLEPDAKARRAPG